MIIMGLGIRRTSGLDRRRPWRTPILGMLGIVVVFLRSGTASDWPSVGASPRNDRSTTEIIPLPLSALPADGAWSVSLGDAPVTATPAVVDGIVYAAAGDGRLHARLASDGSPAWPSPVRIVGYDSNACNAGPLVTGGRVIVPGMDHSLTALDEMTGSVLWQVATDGNTISSPAAINGMLFLGAGFPRKDVLALDASDGSPVWTSTLESMTYSSPAVSNGVVVIGCVTGRFYGLDADTGSSLWDVSTGGNVFAGSPAISGTRVFLLPGDEHTDLYSRLLSDGSADWSAPIQDPSVAPAWTTIRASSPAVAAGAIVYVAGDRNGSDLVAFARDETTGVLLWSQTLGLTDAETGVTAPPACSTTHAFIVGQDTAALFVLDLGTGAIVDTLPLDAPARSAPILANGKVFVATRAGTLYAFASANSAPPAPASGFSPTGGATLGTAGATLSWDPALDPDGDPVQYVVRYDDDGDLLDAAETSPSALTNVALGPFADGAQVVWSVRTIDSNGAASPLSAVQTFGINIPSLPPASFTAVPADGGATLTWTPSPSSDIDHYEAAMALSGTGLYGAAVDVGSSGSFAWGDPLTNNIAYDFSLVAIDDGGLTSTAVYSTVIPMPPVTLEDSGGGSTACPSIEAALASASPGDTVRLPAGIFGLLSTLALPEGVTLAGEGVRLTRIEGHLSANGALIQVDSTNGWTASVRDLTLSNPGSSPDRPGVLADGGVVSLRNVLILDTTTGIRGENGADVEVINVTIASPTEFGIDLLDTQSSIRNTLVTGAGLIGMRADPLSSPSTSLGYSNVVGSGISNYDGLSPDANSFSTAVTYVDSASGDYREVVGSPTVDTGDPADPYDQEPYHNGGRVNIGAFGNTSDATVNSLPATPASGFSPTGGVVLGVDSATLAWDGVVDPDPADVTISYVVRYDTDGDLVDYVELPGTTATSVGLTGLPDNAAFVWAVQAVDPKGAPSAFSATQSFAIRIPPAPVASFAVAPANGAATLTWGASPSADVDHYEAAVRLSGGGAFGVWVDVGAGVTYSWPGLTNSTAYDFTIQAVDGTALSSTTVEASVMPAPPVALVVAGGGSTSYASLAAALAAAVAGDTVQLGANDYGVISTLSLPEGVTLAGAGVRLTRIEGHLSADGAVVRVNSTSGQTARIRDLTLRNPGSSADRPGVLADGGVVALQNVLLLDTTTGIRAESGADIGIANVTIVSPTGFGIDLLGSQSSIRNTLITGAGQSGIRADAPAALLVTLGYNDVVGSGVSNYSGLSPDANSISAAVTYVDTLSGDYREEAGSPTVDAGDPVDSYSLEPYYNGGRINIGAFGNTADATTTTPPTAIDADGDGILDSDEIAIGTDPASSDTDGDGVGDAAEIGFDPSAPTDADGDGISNALESTASEGSAVAMDFVLSDTEADGIGLSNLSGSTITLTGDAGALSLARVTSPGFSTPLENTTAEGGAPSGYTMPFGVLRFDAIVPIGGTTTVTVAYSVAGGIPSNAVFFKFTTVWSAFAGASGLGDGNGTFTLTLTDGGAGDSDGVANGVIVDPGAIGVPVPAPPPAPSGGSTTTTSTPISSGSTAAAASSDGGGGGGGGCFVSAVRFAPGVILVWPLALLALSLRRRRGASRGARSP